MKRLFLLLFISLILGCNNDTPKTNIHVLVINNVSYNLTEEAYNSLNAYLEYLKEYYSSEDNSEEIINTLSTKIAEELNQKLQDENDAVTQSELETIIEGIKQQGENGDLSEIPAIPGIEQIGTAPLTMLAYLVANNNLDDDLLANIGAMYDGLAAMDKEATLLVYWDGKTSIGTNNTKHLILKYETDGKGNINGTPALDMTAPLDDVLEIGEIVKEYDTQYSVDKTVMSQVLKDMVAIAPTDKLGLVFGSHASSWLKSIYTSRAFGQDGSGDNTMLIPDMVEAVSSVGKKFEFILFDACYMGTAEVAYAFRNVCDYQLSSVMEVPAYGFPYEDFMQYLYKGNADNYKKVCQSYIDFYQSTYAGGSSAWATVSLIDSKEVDNLVGELKKEIVGHKDALADYDTDHLQEYGRSSGPYIALDMGHMIKDLNGGSLPSAFSTQLDKTVLYKGYLEKARPSSYAVVGENYSGLGIYIPVEERPKWNDYFKTLDWYTASGWSEVTFSWDF